MADTPEDDELLLEDKAEGEEPETDETEEKEQGSEESGDLDDEELEIAFGDEAAPASGERDSSTMHEVRQRLREEQRARREAERKLAAAGLSEPSTVADPGPEPTLEQFEWDDVKHREAYREWFVLDQAFQRQKSAQKEAQEAALRHWGEIETRYTTGKGQLKVPDFEVAEAAVLQDLGEGFRGIIAAASEKPEALMYALGRSPDKRDKLKAYADLTQKTNLIEAAFALGKLEGTLKVAPRRKAPEPEQVERGNAAVSPKASDKDAERLEKRAMERGGDVSDLLRRNREKRRAGQA